MPSNLSDKIGYLQERVRNAVAMLRRGEFRLIARNFGIEIGHRAEAVRGKMRHHAVITSRAATISARQAQQKIRQLRAGAAEAAPGDAPFDEVPVDQIIPDSAFRNSRKLVPASPCATNQRQCPGNVKDAEAQIYLDTLQTIADALQPTKSV